jgi:sugar phosphate isomerase/epimerase
MTQRVLILLFLMVCLSCSSNQNINQDIDSTPKLSLAQWSFHKELKDGRMSNQGFIKAAAEMGFEGVEYVDQFFDGKVKDFPFLDDLKATAKTAGIKNLLIMVDRCGNIGASDEEERNRSVDKHKEWVDVAKYLGCTAIRINAHGDGDAETLKSNCIKGITQLAKYANSQGINILIENHGGMSNNGTWMVSMMEGLKGQNIYTLPDFDNWCWEREGGSYWSGKCIKRYDRYQGVRELLPYAKALSVKGFEFDKNGDETTIDFYKMMNIVRKSKYQGYLGIEYEGNSADARSEILRLKTLAIKAWKSSN